ncbi:MAG: hypothetical protein WDN10_00260 [bacterium]
MSNENHIGKRTQKLAENTADAGIPTRSKITWREVWNTGKALFIIGAIVFLWLHLDELLSGFDQEWLAALIIALVGLTGLYLDSKLPKK